jgi:hypothetical protein
MNLINLRQIKSSLDSSNVCSSAPQGYEYSEKINPQDQAKHYKDDLVFRKEPLTLRKSFQAI